MPLKHTVVWASLPLQCLSQVLIRFIVLHRHQASCGDCVAMCETDAKETTEDQNGHQDDLYCYHDAYETGCHNLPPNHHAHQAAANEIYFRISPACRSVGKGLFPLTSKCNAHQTQTYSIRRGWSAIVFSALAISFKTESSIGSREERIRRRRSQRSAIVAFQYSGTIAQIHMPGEVQRRIAET